MNDQHPTLWDWLLKLVLQILIAGLWSVLVHFIWLGVLSFGRIDDEFFSAYSPSRTRSALGLAYLSSIAAGFFGGFTACIVFGSKPNETFRTVFCCSGVGAMMSALLAPGVGISLGSLFAWRDVSKNIIGWFSGEELSVFLMVILVISLPVGICGGWIGGLAVRGPTNTE